MLLPVRDLCCNKGLLNVLAQWNVVVPKSRMKVRHTDVPQEKKSLPPATKEESESVSCCWVRNPMCYSSQYLKIVERIHPVQPSLLTADYGLAGRARLLCGSPCSPSNHRWRLGNELLHLPFTSPWQVKGSCEPWSRFFADATDVYHVWAAAEQQRALRSFHWIFSEGLTRAGASWTAFWRWFQLLLYFLINEPCYILTYSQLWVWNNVQSDTVWLRMIHFV